MISGDMKIKVGKAALHLIPEVVLIYVAMAFDYGQNFYKRWNWRLGNNNLSDYYGAARRHMAKWYEGRGEGPGRDTDPDSKCHHIDAAIASLMILRDLIIGDREGTVPNVKDDRPFIMVADLAHDQLQEKED